MGENTLGATLDRKRSAIVCLAVLPEYRREFVDLVRGDNRISAKFAAGDENFVPSVITAKELIDLRLNNRFFLKRNVMWQSGALIPAVRGNVAVVDLNPRILSAWVVLLVRKSLRRRTLVWGHIHPRVGPHGRFAKLRRGMMMLSDGVICYTYADAEEIGSQGMSKPRWVASNALYARGRLSSIAHQGPRETILYVGRVEREKKIDVLLRGYAQFLRDNPDSSLGLEIVGDGEDRSRLTQVCRELGIEGRTTFHGEIRKFEDLKCIYGRALVAVSPGYAGLSITQSLGFGVPIVVADPEPHAPEIELLPDEYGSRFEADNPSSLAKMILHHWLARQVIDHDRPLMIEQVARMYSAESMANGFICALLEESHA